MSFFNNLSAVIRAGRFWKNLPLLITYFSGIFCLKSGSIPFLILSAGAFSVLLLSFFMTHVNVITDFELDKKRKPHLYKKLWQAPAVAKTLISLELLTSLILVVFVASEGYMFVALHILVFGAVATLYSYNFLFPVGEFPKKHRLKAYWWGHLSVLMVGYVSLWLSGFYTANPDRTIFDSIWLPCFVIVSLSEYSVFLLESSIDTTEEQEQEIKSLSAILGYLKTNWVAIIMNLVAIGGLFLISLGTHEQIRLLICFLPPMFVRLVYEVYMLRVHEPQHRYKLLRHIPDILFNITRVYILITLIFVSP